MTTKVKAQHTPGLLTAAERDELERLQDKWARKQATKQQILRCMELEARAKREARAIAAAPELLAALEAMAREFASYEMSPEQKRIAARAQDAIKKARGE